MLPSLQRSSRNLKDRIIVAKKGFTIYLDRITPSRDLPSQHQASGNRVRGRLRVSFLGTAYLGSQQTHMHALAIPMQFGE